MIREKFYLSNREIREEIWNIVTNNVGPWLYKRDIPPTMSLLLRGDEGVGKTQFLNELKKGISEKYNISSFLFLHFDIDKDKKGYSLLPLGRRFKTFLKVCLRNSAIWLGSFVGLLSLLTLFLLVGIQIIEIHLSLFYSVIPLSYLAVRILMGYKRLSELYKEETGGKKLAMLLKKWGGTLVGKNLSTVKVERNWILNEVLRMISKKLHKDPTIVLWDDIDRHINMGTIDIFGKWWNEVEEAKEKIFLISTVSLSKDDSEYEEISSLFQNRVIDLKLNQSVINRIIWTYLGIDISKTDLPSSVYNEIFSIVKDNLKFLLNEVLPKIKKQLTVKNGIPHLKVPLDEYLASLDIGNKAIWARYKKFKTSLKNTGVDELEAKGKKVLEIILSLQGLPNEVWVTQSTIQDLLKKMGFLDPYIHQINPHLKAFGVKNYKFKYVTTRYILNQLFLKEEMNAIKVQMGLYYIVKRDEITASSLLRKLSPKDIKEFENTSYWYQYCKSLRLPGISKISEDQFLSLIFRKIYILLKKVGMEKFEGGYFYIAKEYLTAANRFLKGLLKLPKDQIRRKEKREFSQEQIILLDRLSTIEYFINLDSKAMIELSEEALNKALSFKKVILNALPSVKKKRRKEEFKKILDETKRIELRLKVDIEFERFITEVNTENYRDWIDNLLKYSEVINAKAINLLKSTQNKDMVRGILLKLQLLKIFLLCSTKIGFTKLAYQHTEEVGKVLDEGLNLIEEHEAKISSWQSALSLYNLYYNLVFIAMLSHKYDKAIYLLTSFANCVRNSEIFTHANILPKAWSIYFKFIVDKLSYVLSHVKEFESSQTLKEFIRGSTPEPSAQRDKIEEELENKCTSHNDALQKFRAFLETESKNFLDYSFTIFSRYSFYKPFAMTPEVSVGSIPFILDEISSQYKFYSTRKHLIFLLEDSDDIAFSLENGKRLRSIMDCYIFNEIDLLAIFNRMSFLYGLLGENPEEGLEIAEKGLEVLTSLNADAKKDFLPIEINLKWYFAEFCRRIGFTSHLERGLTMLDSIPLSHIDWNENVNIRRLKGEILVEKYLKTGSEHRDSSILKRGVEMLNECMDEVLPRVKEIKSKEKQLYSLVRQLVEQPSLKGYKYE